MLETIRNNETLFGWLFAVSAVTFFGTLAIVPWLVARIPADYFVRPPETRSEFHGRHPAFVLLAKLMKNAAGVVFLAAGVAMLVLPGQGLLTILIGLMLIDFPGKRRFELALIRRSPVLKAVNWMRGKAGREPLLVSESDD